MTQREELVVLLRTVAENQGATQTQNALRNVSKEADQANASLRRTGQVARESGEGMRVGTEQILRFAGALTGVEVGLSLFTTAGETVRETIVSAVDAQRENERINRATAASYGASAESFQRFAAGLAQQTGFTRQAILEAALSARTLSENYGLTTQQTQKLITVSADLARVRGIGVAEAFERVQSAIRGEAEASEFLGLTLNATFLQQNAANGAYKQTFTTLTDAQRAQVVYNEVLRQTAAFQGLAQQTAGNLDDAFRNADRATTELKISLGQLIQPEVVAFLGAVAEAADKLSQSTKEAQSRGGLNAVLANLPQIPEGALPGPLNAIPALERAARIAAQAQAATDQQNAALQRQGQLLAENARNSERAELLIGPAAQVIIRPFSLVNESLQKTHSTLAQIAQDITDLAARSGQLSTVQQALSPNDTQGQTVIGAQQVLQQIDAQINARKTLLAIEQEIRREQEATKITDPRDAAGSRAAQQRLDTLQQILPAEQALIEAQKQARDLQLAGTQIQAQEAALTLQILPQRQKIADIERQINDLGSSRVTLLQQQTVLLAQQRALRPQNALDDTQAQIQRDQLLLKVRGVDPETRRQARQQIRDLTRNVLPQQELNAFDANRQVSLAERDQRSTQIQIQLQQNALQQAKQVIQDAIQPTEDAIREAQNQGQQIQLLGQIAQAVIAARQQAIQVIIQGAVEVTTGGADAQSTIPAAVGQKVAIDVANQMREGLGQMQLPPAVQQSGVRRAA